MLRRLPFVLLLLVLPAGPAAHASQCELRPSDGPSAMVARTDHQASGNRLVVGCGALRGDTFDVDVGGTPSWVLPNPTARGWAWLVTLDDGRIVHVVTGPEGDSSVRPAGQASLAPGEPPVAAVANDSQVIVGSALEVDPRFEDLIPQARVVEAPDASRLVLAGPTQRYAHGVLGDDVEASSVAIQDAVGTMRFIEVADDEVIEGLSPLLADLDGDGSSEVVVTVSTPEVGARLVAYDLDGTVAGRSDAIGQGFRWMHQIAAAPLVEDGDVEIIAVRTPHIGGIVEAYRLVDGRLELVASLPGYSSHRLGSPNLDMALLADVDGDGQLDIVVPTQDMTTLGVLARSPDGLAEIGSLPLDGRLTTNVAATADADGALVFAAGTEDGRLRIFR
jgi:hypothetical protein